MKQNIRFKALFALIASTIACTGLLSGEALAPVDKNLDPGWVASLTERNHPRDAKITGSKEEDSLKYIGMTVGGIGTGTVYLGGDGQLWIWDIFNQFRSGVVANQCPLPAEMRARFGGRGINARQGANYVDPPTAERHPGGFEQGFGIRVGDRFLRFEASDWENVSFEGNWPIGNVHYRSTDVPVEVDLRGFTPFIPLNLDDSSLPITLMEYTVRNTSDEVVSADLVGWLENAVGMESRKKQILEFTTERSVESGVSVLQNQAVEKNKAEARAKRADIIFADFEELTYTDWAVQGDAFGDEPIHKNNVPPHQGNLNLIGERGVNSHASAKRNDRSQGKLISPEFVISRPFMRFMIGGGAHQGQTCLNLIVDGEVVRSETGDESNKMTEKMFLLEGLVGKTAHFEIVDTATGAWGHIGVDHIVFSDKPLGLPVDFDEAGDNGSMALAVSDADASAIEHDGFPGWSSQVILQPGESKRVTFMVAWHFPNIMELPGFPNERRAYAARFGDAQEVVDYTVVNARRLMQDTEAWVTTWYDSTLPAWFLDRTLLTANTLQSSNCFVFEDGQFWGWEGVGACPGTCTHVWQYAQAVARLFPSLERNLREVTDYDYAQMEDGGIRFRGTYPEKAAKDGQAGIILRTYREHLMSPDDAFLQRVWPDTKRALEYLINHDIDNDGILDGGQHNTLDASWYGPVAWLSGHYQAALRAGEAMAILMGDETFAEETRAIYESGQEELVDRLFNGEYFINLPDPSKADSINSGSGVLIDQVFGQSWAFQVGLDRVLPVEETRSALNALWRYNYFPDVGIYRDQHKIGRWYALPGESGLLMCTFPKPDWNYHKASGGGKGFAQYFNECMTGFEYQVASHMIYEGTPDLVEKGLAITRSIHDRYAPEKRNPYNEVECSDHYARAAASYGVFLAASGFDYDGPQGFIAFAPRVSPENFKAAFTTAEGWGSYSQMQQDDQMTASLDLRYGNLKLNKLSVQVPAGFEVSRIKVNLGGRKIRAKFAQEDGSVRIELVRPVKMEAGDTLNISISR